MNYPLGFLAIAVVSGVFTWLSFYVAVNSTDEKVAERNKKAFVVNLLATGVFLIIAAFTA